MNAPPAREASAAPALPADAGDGLASARLVLRRYTPADLPALAALNADAEVMRFLGGPMSAEDTRQMLESRILQYYDEHPGLGVWLTSLRATGEVIGFHLLNHIRGESLIQVGYRLAVAHWGKGYATEMSLALLEYGFLRLGLPQIVAITHPDNAGSQQVLRKLGLQQGADRAFAHPSYAGFGPLSFFSRDASSWFDEHGRLPKFASAVLES